MENRRETQEPTPRSCLLPSSCSAGRKPRVLEICDLKNSTLYELIGRGEFPAGIAISPKVVVWLESEVLEFQQRVIAARRKVPAPQRKAAGDKEAA